MTLCRNISPHASGNKIMLFFQTDEVREKMPKYIMGVAQFYRDEEARRIRLATKYNEVWDGEKIAAKLEEAKLDDLVLLSSATCRLQPLKTPVNSANKTLWRPPITILEKRPLSVSLTLLFKLSFQVKKCMRARFIFVPVPLACSPQMKPTGELLLCRNGEGMCHI